MSGFFKTIPLGKLINENPKSKLKVRDSLSEGDFIFFTSGKKVKAFDNYLCDGENLFIATGGMANISYYNGQAAYSTDCYSITTKDGLLTKFLFYFLLSNLAYINDSMFKGAALKHLQKNMFKDISVPVPSLDSQERIIAILDEAFSRVDTAISNMEKNLANASDVFESFLVAILSNHNEGWENRKLSDILDSQPRNGWSPPAKNHSDIGVPVLTLSSVTGFKFDLSKIKYTSADVRQDAHYWIENGSLLITRSNTHKLVGHVAIVDNVQQATIYPDLIMKMKVDKNIALTKFIYYQLRSRKLRNIISNSAHGANPTMKKINKAIVQGLPVVFPNLDQQKIIVESLDYIFEQSQCLLSIYQKKINLLNELKQSLLQKALSGELTERDDKLMGDAVA